MLDMAKLSLVSYYHCSEPLGKWEKNDSQFSVIPWSIVFILENKDLEWCKTANTTQCNY